MGSPPTTSRSPYGRYVNAQSPLRPDQIAFCPPKRKSGGSIRHKESNRGSFCPTPTYRHLLGTNNLGATNPLRVIAHIDIDAAYAAMEMSRLGLPEDQPLATQQWNGLIAVNYPARQYGIDRHATPEEALKKCPHLKLVHVQTYRNGDTEPGYWQDPTPSYHTHKISLDYYRKESRKILQVFQEFCPIVEKASIDESFLDLTSTVRSLLLSTYPSLQNVPSSGLDTPLPAPREMGITQIDWDGETVGNLIPRKGQRKEKIIRTDSNRNYLTPSSTSAEPSTSISEPQFDLELDAPDAEEEEEEEEDDLFEPEISWSDIALSLGARLVHKIRTTTRQRLGYTCSAGIANNKMLSKLCSGWKKPNAQTILRDCAVENFLKPMKFQKIRNLGGKLGKAVKETFVVETVGDLRQFELSDLQSKLGEESGVWLWEVCRGMDYSEVEAKTNVKSMLSSKDVWPSIHKYGQAIHWLNVLATDLHVRLTEARQDSPGLWPKTITLRHRSPTFVKHSHQSSFPYTSNLTISYIVQQAEKLLRIALDSSAPENSVISSTSFSPSSVLPMSPKKKGGSLFINHETDIGPWGNLQLCFSGLERLEEGQKGIARFLATSSNTAEGTKEQEKVKRAKSEVMEHQQGGGGREEAQLPSPKKRKLEQDDSNAILVLSSPSPSPPPVSRLPTLTCPRPGCSRILEIPSSSLPSLIAADYSRVSITEALKRVEDEERDYHLARDMVEEERKLAGWRTANCKSESPGGVGIGTAKKQKKMKNRVKDESVAGRGGVKKGSSEKQGGQSLGLRSFFGK